METLFLAEVGTTPAGSAQGWLSFLSLTTQEAPHKSGISVITEDESDSVMPIKRVYLSKDHLVITQIPFQFLLPFPHYLGVMSVFLASGLGLSCSHGSLSPFSLNSHGIPHLKISVQFYRLFEDRGEFL